MNLTEAAAKFNVSTNRIRSLIENGQLGATRKGRAYEIDEAALAHAMRLWERQCQKDGKDFKLIWGI